MSSTEEIEKKEPGNLTVGNDEDVLGLLQKMEARMQSLEEHMGVVQKALFHPVTESEPARLPLENDGSKGSASDIRTEEIRSEEVPASQQYHLPWPCYGCNVRGRLTECKNCHHFFAGNASIGVPTNSGDAVTSYVIHATRTFLT